MKKILLLEDGREFEGTAIGANNDFAGKIVYTTGMCGFVEEISNPCNAGNILCFTYPMVGGYGSNSADVESIPSLQGIVVKELCSKPNNYRLETTLQEFLVKNSISGIQGVDTRSLTHHIRNNGSMRALVTSSPISDKDKLLKELKNIPLETKSMTVKTEQKLFAQNPNGKHLVIIDYGVQKSMLDCLLNYGYNISVVPNEYSHVQITELKPDGIVLTGGQGNPADFDLNTVKALISDRIPMLAVGLGNLIVALSQGVKIKKLKNGHRGSNHPVKDLDKNIVYATTQNHEYVADEKSIKGAVKISHINMHDGSIEGLAYVGLPIIAVQFQPENIPGYSKATDIYGMFNAIIK